MELSKGHKILIEKSLYPGVLSQIENMKKTSNVDEVMEWLRVMGETEEYIINFAAKYELDVVAVNDYMIHMLNCELELNSRKPKKEERIHYIDTYKNSIKVLETLNKNQYHKKDKKTLRVQLQSNSKDEEER